MGKKVESHVFDEDAAPGPRRDRSASWTATRQPSANPQAEQKVERLSGTVPDHEVAQEPDGFHGRRPLKGGAATARGGVLCERIAHEGHSSMGTPNFAVGVC